MSNDELVEFENDPLFQNSLKLREYDDMAKETGIELKPLQYFKELLIRFCDA